MKMGRDGTKSVLAVSGLEAYDADTAQDCTTGTGDAERAALHEAIQRCQFRIEGNKRFVESAFAPRAPFPIRPTTEESCGSERSNAVSMRSSRTPSRSLLLSYLRRRRAGKIISA